MATAADSFAFVAASVERAIRLQSDACKRVLTDPASTHAHGLAQHLDDAYAALLAHVTRRRVDFRAAPDNAARDDAIVEMRQLLWSVRELQTNLAWLDATRDSPIDLGTRYYVERVARDIVADDVEVTVVATEHMSYATTSNPFEDLIEGWGTRTGNRRSVVVVLIPRREQHSGLLHPLIVHELGHAADSASGLVDGIWTTARTRSRLSAKFSAAASGLARDQGLDPSDATDHIAERLRAWIAEALCDAIATQLLGPTYLYSFIAEVIAASLDESGPRHPPPRQRVRHIVAQLDRLGWKEFTRQQDLGLDDWVRALIQGRVTYVGVAEFLTWAIDDLRAVIRTAAEKVVGSRRFLPDSEELAEVRALLDLKVPPAQQLDGRKPIQPASIMLCCWHAALAGRGGGPAALAPAADAEEHAELLPAALELSAIVDAWH